MKSENLGNGKTLKRDSSSELKLSRIIGRGWPACIAIERIYIERVVLIDEVEDVGCCLKCKTMLDSKCFGEAEVSEYIKGLQTCIPSE